jgi:preprotein translocase subunit SecG
MGPFCAIGLSRLAIFLILLVLVQRGRGGGLAGALGGMGGSSAFGAKAGDVFTRITIVTAAIWILVCVAAVYWAGHQGDALSGEGGLPGGRSILDDVPRPGAEADKAAPAKGATGAAANNASPATGGPESTSTPASTDAPATTSAPAASAPSGATPADSAPADAPADGK